MLEDNFGINMLNSYNQGQRLKQQTHHHQSDMMRGVSTWTLDLVDPQVTSKDQIDWHAMKQGNQWKIKRRENVAYDSMTPVWDAFGLLWIHAFHLIQCILASFYM